MAACSPPRCGRQAHGFTRGPRLERRSFADRVYTPRIAKKNRILCTKLFPGRARLLRRRPHPLRRAREPQRLRLHELPCSLRERRVLRRPRLPSSRLRLEPRALRRLVRRAPRRERHHTRLALSLPARLRAQRGALVVEHRALGPQLLARAVRLALARLHVREVVRLVARRGRGLHGGGVGARGRARGLPQVHGRLERRLRGRLLRGRPRAPGGLGGGLRDEALLAEALHVLLAEDAREDAVLQERYGAHGVARVRRGGRGDAAAARVAAVRRRVRGGLGLAQGLECQRVARRRGLADGELEDLVGGEPRFRVPGDDLAHDFEAFAQGHLVLGERRQPGVRHSCGVLARQCRG
ncbi:hypothetical protein B0H17DRAFT_1050476 [Mycena rosella]|uniref:Uncharacterized protein n=1 Tax=Mycena rosella TaxID=1033263 RepID=A0AAD7DTF9_MYCRO|nr:hypothetical protein B0H17DRAFT_1050476 [Mycena rosella]